MKTKFNVLIVFSLLSVQVFAQDPEQRCLQRVSNQQLLAELEYRMSLDQTPRSPQLMSESWDLVGAKYAMSLMPNFKHDSFEEVSEILLDFKIRPVRLDCKHIVTKSNRPCFQIFESRLPGVSLDDFEEIKQVRNFCKLKTYQCD